MNLCKKLIVFTLLLVVCSKLISVQADDLEDINEQKQNILIFMMAYPDYIRSIEKSTEGLIYFIMFDGSKILYDDKKNKNSEESFYSTDLQDMLKDKYPLEDISEVYTSDPGRLRNYKLLSSVYGNNKVEVEKNLINVSTKYGSVIFNKCNNAANNLKCALDEIYDASLGNNKINNYVSPINGTFNYRRIQDTGMLSPHAYGIAIDLNRNDLDYWKWTDSEKASKRIANYPKEVVRIFEKYGFVWGGKWQHFDILHFEYKPETIIKAKYFQNYQVGDDWYKGIDENEETNKMIEMINSILD